MKLKNLQKSTSKLLLVNKNIFRNFEPNENSLNINIKYWLKTGSLITLKKGLYVFRDKYEKETQKDLYLEYIANQLIQPSYLSLEYVLAQYQLLSEPVNAITSVTVKTTREINNKLGFFRYYSFTPALFKGYKIKFFNKSPIMIAEKPKAIFDFLYLRFCKNAVVRRETIEELRLNWENVSKKELKEVKLYASLTRSRQIKLALGLINKLYF